jgi:hypothetical protein
MVSRGDYEKMYRSIQHQNLKSLISEAPQRPALDQKLVATSIDFVNMPFTPTDLSRYKPSPV